MPVPALPTPARLTSPENACGEFNAWAQQFAATPAAARAALEEEGARLAKQRLTALAELIQTNPQQACELAVSPALRRTLPKAVQAWLEEPINARGDYEVLCILPGPDQGHTAASVVRLATINGESHRVFTFGRALNYVSRTNAPLNGLAVPAVLTTTDPLQPRPAKLMALTPSPARALDPVELNEHLAVASQPAMCPVCARAVTGPDAAALQLGGETRVFCDQSHADEWAGMAIAAEQLALPAATAAANDWPTAESSYTEGTKRLLFLRVGFPDYTNTIGSNTAVTLIGTLSNYFATMSYGKMKVAPIGSSGSAVTPVMRMPNDSSYYDDAGLSRLYPAAKTAAGNIGYSVSSYHFIVVFTSGSKPSYGYAGLGYVGGVGVHIANGYWQNHTVTHELGHNLGIWHAKRHDTGDKSIIGDGDTVEYGDYYDQMGTFGNDRQHYGASHKNFIDWIPDSNVQTAASGTHTYRMYAHDRINSGGLRGIKVSRSSSQDYWAEFRQQWSDRDMRYGLLLHWAEKDGNPATMLDAMPAVDGDGLVIGRTFSDTSAGIHITPIGHGGTDPDWMDVVMTVGNVSSNKAPVAIVSASRTTASTGQSVTFTADATDANGDALAYYWEFGDGSYTVDNEPEVSHSFSSAGEYPVQCTVSDMKGGTARDTVIVKVGSPSTYRISGRVLDSGSKPVVGMKVYTGSRYAFSDSDGTYTITGLSAADYSVYAREIVKDTTVFSHPFFSNPIHVGPNFTNANFITSTNPGLKMVYVFNPLDDAVFNDPASITVNASAQSQTSSVTKVEFYADNVKFGEDTNSPYSASWTNLTFGLHALKAKATFSDSSTATSGDVNVTINFTDRPPTLTAITNRAVNEDTSTGPITFTIGDTITPASNLVVTATSGNTNLVPDSRLVLGGSGANRTLTILAATNLSGTALITLRVNDGVFTTTTNFTLTVNAVNDPPFITPPASLAIAEDASSLPLAFTVSDLESPASNLVVTARSANTNVIPNTGLLLGGAGTNRTLVVTPRTNQTGAVAITLTASDGGASNSASFTVTVNNVNDPPFLSSLTNRTVPEDTMVSVPFVMSDLETPLSNLLFTITSTNTALVPETNLVVSGTSTNRTLTITPATNRFGSTLITLTVSDAQFTTTSAFALNVTAVADPPAVFNVTGPTNGAVVSAPVLLATDAGDPDGNLANVNFIADGITLGAATNAPWSLVWSNAALGSHSVQAVAVDSGGLVRWSSYVRFQVVTGPITLIPTGAVWNFLDNGSNQGTGWRNPAFDDSAWHRGPAELGYGDGDEATVVSYGSNSTNKYPTTYFRHPFVVNDPAGVTNLIVNFKRDDGLVLYLNGVEALRDNMSTGLVTYLTFTTNTVDGAEEDAWLTNTLDTALLPLLRNGTNWLAAEIHQAKTNSSDISFDLSLAALVVTNRPRGVWLAAPASVPWLSEFPVSAEVVAGGGLSVTNMLFLANGSIVGETAAPPWNCTVSNPPVGTCTLRAVALDSAGGAFTSAPVNVAVLPPPPGRALVNFGEDWKFLDTGAAPATNWIAAGFVDTTWGTGPARLGYGGDGEATRISYGPDSGAKYTTTWFRKKFTVVSPASFRVLRLRVVRDDGVLVFLNGAEVLRDNLPDGPIAATNFALTAIGGTNETLPIEAELANLLVPGENTLAVEIHQATKSSSDLGFDLQLLGLASTNLTRGVYLTAPAQGERCFVDVPLAAFAQSTQAVTLVEYYGAGLKVAEAAAPPYAAVWTNAPGGAQLVFARAWLADGSALDSPPVAITVTPGPVIMPLFQAGANWRYLDDGTDPGTNWFTDMLDDSAWPSGPAKLGFGDTNNATTLQAGFITYYFRSGFFVPINYLATNLTLRLVRDDGAVIYLNGVEIHRDNMPTGEVTAATLAASGVSGANETNWFVTALDPGVLQLGLNLIAAEVHQSTNTSTDIGFALELIASGTLSTNVPPPDPPVVLVQPSENGLLHFGFPEFDGRVFVIEASLDMQDWTPVWTNSVLNGQFDFYADPALANRQFYRVKWSP